MRRNATFTGLLVLIASACVGYFLVRHWARIHGRASVTERDNELRANLRPGMSREQIEAYLDRNAIPHSYIENAGAPPESRWTEIALIKDSGRFDIVRRDIEIVFRFDRAGTLMDYSEKEHLAGP